MPTTVEIDRRTASKILGVSMRTIDRYIKRGKLPARKDNDRIWLDKKEIMQFSKYGTLTRHWAGSHRQLRLTSSQQKNRDNDFYRDLYEDAKRSIIEHQQKLELANYRIGQAESQIITSQNIKPQTGNDDALSQELIRHEIIDREKENDALKSLLKKEKTNSAIFAALTYLLLALLPLLWYLLR